MCIDRHQSNQEQSLLVSSVLPGEASCLIRLNDSGVLSDEVCLLSAGEALNSDTGEDDVDADIELVDRQGFLQLCQAMLARAEQQKGQIQQALQQG